MNYKFSYEENWTYETSKTLSTYIECHAVKGKKMMCFPYYTSYQLSVPYKASLTYLNYKKEIKKDTNVFGIYKKKICTDNKPDVLCKDLIEHCFQENKN